MTTAQRQTALRNGERIRLARAADRQHIRTGNLHASTLITDPPPHWHTALLYDLLLTIPHFGYGKLRAFNARAMRAGVNVCAPLGELASRQRAFVVDYLRERGL